MSNRSSGKKKEPINAIGLLFLMIVVAVILTYIIPAGQYDRVQIGARMAVDPNSFHFIEQTPASLFDIFVAVHAGMNNAAGMIFAALAMGGSLGIIQHTGAINAGISSLIRTIGINRGSIILVIMYYIFAAMGGFLGFIEGSLPFWPIMVSIALALGYDGLTGIAIAMVSGILGFTAGPTNPLTVALGHTLSGLPMFSGIGYRVILFVLIPMIGLIYILRYAEKVRKDPTKSLQYGIDVSDLTFDVSTIDQMKFTWKHAVTLLVLVAGMGCYVYGGLNWGWVFSELAGIFILTALVAAVLDRLSINETVAIFTKGAQSMVGAAFVMGIAYGISWVLSSGNILDTVVYYLSAPLKSLPVTVAVFGMFIVIALINLLIPSGSGKAMILLPISLPLADILGIAPQMAILAYQLGDGFTNFVTPLAGTILLGLSFSRTPLTKWYRFITPLVGILVLSGIGALFVAQIIGYA